MKKYEEFTREELQQEKELLMKKYKEFLLNSRNIQ